MEIKSLYIKFIIGSIIFLANLSFAAEIKFLADMNLQNNYITNIYLPVDGADIIRKSYVDYLLDTTYLGKISKPGNARIDIYETGMPWPVPRFIDNNDQTITDRLTGLMWTKRADLNHCIWSTAVSYCRSLNAYGYNDWRLPNIKEIISLLDFSNFSPCLQNGHPFTSVKNERYWSSTFVNSYLPNPNYKWALNMADAHTSRVGASHVSPLYYVWPVRSIDIASKVRCQPQKTGQTVQDRTGDDGTYQAGLAVPPASSRFSVHSSSGSETNILDSFTGLIWTKQANLGGKRLGSNVYSYCNSLVYGGFDDWRNPTITEILSLTDFGTNAPSLPSGHPFINVQNGNWVYYWSSTRKDNYFGWRISLDFAEILQGRLDKTYNQCYCWPVRGGN